MKRALLFIISIILFVLPKIVQAQCNQTLNPGDSIASALSSASSGDTICLNAGSYSAYNSSITKTSMTTVISSPGLTRDDVTVASVTANTSQFIKFQKMTIGGGSVGGSSSPGLHIHFVDIEFTGSLCINNPTNVNQDTLVDSSTFANVGSGCTEGRMGITGNNNSHTVSSGIVISNNVFGPGGCSDGIQLIGGARGVQIIGNEFVGIKQGSCSPEHVDPIQFYGAEFTVISNNYFHGNSTGIMSPDCNGDNSTVTNNVFVTDGEYPDQIVQSGANAGTYNHNTFGPNARIRFGNPNGCGLATNVTLTNNIIRGGLNLTEGQSTSSFTINFNNGIGGSNAITGTPTWTGGASPTTWDGWELASGSVGENGGSDGQDIGTLYYGASASSPPTITITAPTSSATYNTSTSPLTTLAGTASDDVAVTSVTWSCNVCGSGTATGTTSWSVSSITLQPGDNIITVTAHDGDGQTGQDILTVTYTPPNPVVTITAPTSNTTYVTGSSSFTTLAGTASDDVAVTSVTWSCDVCGSGTATGTTSWSVGSITLQLGDNVITVTAHDADTNTGQDQITVTYTTGDITSNLLSHWKLNSTTVDNGSNAQNGTLVGSPSYDVVGNCKVGTSCLLLNGSTQYMTVVQNGEYNLHASPFTIAMWIKDDTSAATLSTLAHRIISWYTGVNGIAVGIGSPNGTDRFYYASNRTFDGTNIVSSPIATGWNHVAATFDGSGTYHMYVNGVLDDAQDATPIGVFTGNSTTLYVGQRGDGVTGTFVNGSIDDVRIYGRELNAIDVSFLYQFSESSVQTVIKLVK